MSAPDSGTPAPPSVAVVGLGYVGLPLAVRLAAFVEVIGYDIDRHRIDELEGGVDRTGSVSAPDLEQAQVTFSHDEADLDAASVYIVTAPTPIDEDKRPNLGPLMGATEAVGRHLNAGDVAVFESTVYPGVTEEVCVPILERESGLTHGRDFAVAYSPERINPGDDAHTLASIVKVVAGDMPATTERVAALYEQVVEAGVHRAPSIRVAEAAKVIENTQRDLNIALVNELAIIFDRMGIRTADVLAAARTKWNFLPFTPGLVGGHCIGVDPYYLTAKAEQLGYHPEMILAGRRINDGMGGFIAQRTVKLLARQDRPLKEAVVGVVGLTFKENVPDLRNSRVPDIVHELRDYGMEVRVHDPVVDAEAARAHYGLELCAWERFSDLDAMIVAVPHGPIVACGAAALAQRIRRGGALIDVKSALDPDDVPQHVTYWSL